MATVLTCLLLLALAFTSGRSGWRATQLIEQTQDDDARGGGLWTVPNSVQDDDNEVRSGQKVLNRGHIRWYWIPPRTEPSAEGPRRLDASGRVAGDPHSSKVTTRHTHTTMLHVRRHGPSDMSAQLCSDGIHVLTVVFILPGGHQPARP